MLSTIDERLLGRFGPWNCQTQILTPQNVSRPPRSVILLHGFIGSPYDLKKLGQTLFKSGFRVVIPAMKGQNWSDPVCSRFQYSSGFYLNFVRDLVEKETRSSGQRPFLAGFSMGGTIATIIAAENRVEKLVLIAPFFKLAGVPDHVWKVTKALAGILPAVPKLSKGRINDPQGYSAYVPGSYFVSLEAFNHLGRLAVKARTYARKGSTKTLVFISRKDRVACSKITVSLFENRKNVAIRWVDRANHILLHDFDADRIVRETAAFLTAGF